VSTKEELLKIANIEIHVVRKDIKRMHLAVYPPKGRIRLAAPLATDAEVLRLFAISKLSWIKKHVKGFKEQSRETPKDYVPGESHYFLGQRYLLQLKTNANKNQVLIKGSKKLELQTNGEKSRAQKAVIVKEWYRQELKALLPDIVKKWEQTIGVNCSNWGVKHMKTKWGSCNTDRKTIWLNLELAKKPLICLEYIVVHELVHLLERHHNDRFIKYMDSFMPKWRLHRDELNSLPVVHNDWGY